MKKGRIIALVVALLIPATLVACYQYLFGKMDRDRFTAPESLSVVDTGNIVRVPTIEQETVSEGILDEDGNLTDLKLPYEALAILEEATADTTERKTETETETKTETESETETETETKAPETKAPETKAPETRPPETKPVETRPIGDAVQLDKHVSYLLPGSDKIKVFVVYGLDAKTASDVIILTAVDPIHNKVKIISIARDTYSYISEKGAHSKLNYAYSMGGPTLAVKTLNENFYLHVEDYVAVNFEQTASLVDIMGGVDVELREDEIEAIYAFRDVMTPGVNHLNGEQALSYARLRYIDNDLSRNTRQRKIVAALYDKFRTLNVTKYPELIRETAGLCATSFTDAELLSLGTTVLGMKSCTFEQYNFPNANTSCWTGYIDELLYFVYDTSIVSDQIYKIIYEDYYVSGYVS